jgi:hypothetical protein
MDTHLLALPRATPPRAKPWRLGAFSSPAAAALPFLSAWSPLVRLGTPPGGGGPLACPTAPLGRRNTPHHTPRRGASSRETLATSPWPHATGCPYRKETRQGLHASGPQQSLRDGLQGRCGTAGGLARRGRAETAWDAPRWCRRGRTVARGAPASPDSAYPTWSGMVSKPRGSCAAPANPRQPPAHTAARVCPHPRSAAAQPRRRGPDGRRKGGTCPSKVREVGAKGRP